MAVAFRWGKYLPKQIADAINALMPPILSQVENLAAGADITTRAILEVPIGSSYTLTSVKVISQGTPSGIDNSNTCVVQVLNGTNAIANITFDATTAFPAENVSVDMGALDATYKVLAAGEKLYYSVTNGATADPPAFLLQVEYSI